MGGCYIVLPQPSGIVYFHREETFVCKSLTAARCSRILERSIILRRIEWGAGSLQNRRNSRCKVWEADALVA